jgi:putative sigma-54 modulation protein
MEVRIVAPQTAISANTHRQTMESLSYALDRLQHAIREVRVTLRDENGPKGGADKVCLLRLRMVPRGVVVVSKKATEILGAVALAAESAKLAVSRRLERRPQRARRSAFTH